MKILVITDRGSGKKDKFTGEVIGETTTHYLVKHETNDKGELMAKNSSSVQCLEI